MADRNSRGLYSSDHEQWLQNAAIAGSLNAIALADLAGNLLYVNAAFLRLWRYAEADVLGQPAVNFWQQPLEAAEIIAVLERQGSWHGQIVAKRGDGTHFDAQIAASLVRDGDGAPLCMLGVFVDINQYRQTERELRTYTAELNERVKELRTLYEISRLTDDVQMTEEGYLERVVALLPPGWQYSDDACARIDLGPQTYATDNYRKTEWQQRSPIFLNGDAVGEVTVGYLTEHPAADEGPFLSEERSLLAEVARIIGRFVARNLAILELQESEERFRAIFEQAAVGLAQVTPAGGFTRVNQKFCEILGYANDELLARTFQEITHPDDLARDLALVDAVLAGERTSYSMEKRYIRSDGQIVWAMLSVSLIRNGEGRPKYFISVIEDISRRKQAEAALSQSEARYRALFEDSPISLFEQDFSAVRTRIDQLAQEGIVDFRTFFESHPEIVAECIGLVRTVAINRASLGLYGASDKEELLATLDRLVPSDVQRPFIDELVWIAEGRTSFTWEGVNRRLDDAYIHIRLHWSVPSGYEDSLKRALVSIEDITARKRAEDALLASEERYRNVSELTSDFAFALDKRADGALSLDWITDAFTRITGYDTAQFYAAEEWWSLLHPDDVGATEAAIERLLSGRPVVHEARIQTKNRGWRWLRVHLQPKIDHDGEQISGFQGAGQDITEYKRIEEQMIRRERLAAMGQIAATLAHEVKNPLQAIQANLDLLGDFPLEPDERAETLAICRDEVSRLVKITRNILSVSRVDPEARRLLSIGEIWESALNLTHSQVREAGIQVAVDLPANLPKIRGSMEQLSQVMLNLLLNAIENMPGGGRMTISARRQGNQVAVAVTNDGPPIPDQILGNLFEPFVTTKAAGTGLGLFVSQTILHQHSGALIAKNLPEGRGVRFTFTLPIATEEANP